MLEIHKDKMTLIGSLEVHVYKVHYILAPTVTAKESISYIILVFSSSLRSTYDVYVGLCTINSNYSCYMAILQALFIQ